MKIDFKYLSFVLENEKIFLKSFGGFESVARENFVEITVSGRNKISTGGIKMCDSSEARLLKYLSHTVNENHLEIVQENDIIRVKTVFDGYDNTNTVRVHTEVVNISPKAIILEDVSSFVLGGIVDGGYENIDDMYITEFIQSHHSECQPAVRSFVDCGFIGEKRQGSVKRRIAFANIGGWSTKERLPQAIIENRAKNKLLMFQIESNNSWYYEISNRCGDMYLYTGYASMTHGSWSKRLMPNECYVTVNTAITTGDSLNHLLAEMTKYRRHICGLSKCDKHLPSIFNEYMHLSWDSPTEENTKICAPVVAKMGIEYYVIDCGWHNEEPGNKIYPYVGQWKESKARFPSGLKKTMDYIKSLGMKPGLWIEPEVVGISCNEMLDYYDDDCFFTRGSERVTVFNRHFLDYRNPKVADYMTETICTMVEDYGAEYIKFDYNQEPGIGTELKAISLGEGLELCSEAFLAWVENMKKRFPDVIFEGCASGGMRMDYRSLSVFSLMSTSDQVQYDKYPYIAGNVLAAVIPEQAAVWSYPVGECTKEEITQRQIVFNMVNSFLGRMHLASHLEYMSNSQLALVKEGVEYYNKISDAKKNSVPYLPLGFTKFGEMEVAAGFKTDGRIYLAVWNLDKNPRSINIPFDLHIVSACITFPSENNCSCVFDDNMLKVDFAEGLSAVFLEIVLE